MFDAASMALWFFGTVAAAARDKDFAFTEFGKLPVVFNGRVKPMDSLARNSLLQIREKQTLNLEPWKDWNEKPKIIPATEWLANVMMNPAVADDWPVFRVDNPDLISLLKLPEKDAAQHQDGKHYSWNQIAPSLRRVRQGKSSASRKSMPPTARAYENAVVKMHRAADALRATAKHRAAGRTRQDWKAGTGRIMKI